MTSEDLTMDWDHFDRIPPSVRRAPIRFGRAPVRRSIIIAFVLPVCAAVAIAVIAFFAWPAHARDDGQWEATTPEIRQWYSELKQPDNPRISCCGEADAYYADIVVTRNGIDYAIITDTRDDAPLGRPHVPVGTEIEIPPHKYKWDMGNPTGHRVIFLSSPSAENIRNVYCFVDGGGV